MLDALDRRRSRALEASGDPGDRAKSRWLATAPGPELTWGATLGGDAFVAAARSHGAFGEDRAVLEVGPGYGRILSSCLEQRVPFARYVGLDLSAENVRHLSDAFDDPRVEFVQGDVETTDLDRPVDTVVSSLTFKHLYPSFAAALANLSRQLSGRGIVLFDLIEGSRRYFQRDEKTYIREYGRDEVERILAAASLRVLAFDEVAHDAEHKRLLVVAAPTTLPPRRPAASN
jgi:SAM-dependent methyltransferase